MRSSSRKRENAGIARRLWFIALAIGLSEEPLATLLRHPGFEEALGYSFDGTAWNGPISGVPTSARDTEADAMHSLLVLRADKLLTHFIHEVVREELMGGDEAVGLA